MRTRSFFLQVPLSIMLAGCGAEPAPQQVTNETQQQQTTPAMLILRGIASPENPRGQLDDGSALEYARRVGFRGEVMDVAGVNRRDSEQVKLALTRIREDDSVKALYGFSGGGYNTRLIWQELSLTERRRLHKIIVIGAPGVSKEEFQGAAEVIIKEDPPEGHMAGPKSLLDSFGDRG